MKYLRLFALATLTILSMGFVIAEDSNVSNVSNSTITCKAPACEGRYDTGKLDDMGCPIYECRPVAEVVTENVVCSFVNTGSSQKCYSTDGKYSCAASPVMVSDGKTAQVASMSCATKVSGYNGEKIDWKSSCDSSSISNEGTQYTTIDGDDETITFDCSGNLTQPPVEGVAEKVKCVFVNATSPQECYIAAEKKYFSCTSSEEVPEACVMEVSGNADSNSQMTWKSSCGGYAYTTLDGNNEYATFYCSEDTKVETNLFSSASWECHGTTPPGTRTATGAGGDTCRSPDEWMQIAKDACQLSCDKETGKCGVNSFNIGDKCGTKVIVNPKVDDKQPIDVKTEVAAGATISCNGCLAEDKCYPLGYRKEGQFCSDSNEFIAQLDADLKCDNNFECGSNICVSGQCISSGLIENILNWFKKLFGG